MRAIYFSLEAILNGFLNPILFPKYKIDKITKYAIFLLIYKVNFQ